MLCNQLGLGEKGKKHHNVVKTAGTQTELRASLNFEIFSTNL